MEREDELFDLLRAVLPAKLPLEEFYGKLLSEAHKHHGVAA